MKKFLPLILLLVGIVALVGVFVFIKGKGKGSESTTVEETALLDLSLDERPIASLTPTEDGHYLKLKVEKMDFGAFSMDYELLYQVPGGVQQGVPGSVNVDGKSDFETDLLLGSESSGKFRYDEGVEEGGLTLRFRNEGGKLLAKFETDFHKQNDTDTLTSPDGMFTYKLDSSSSDYFVTMNTIGLPGDLSGSVENGPYGVFSSSQESLPGMVEGNVYFWNGESWERAKNNEVPNISFFIISSSE